MRVVAAMSGGVDSSVSALLLREAGHDVVGVFLRNGVEAPQGRGRGHGCCSASDALDAEEVAHLLRIPFYALDEAPAFARIIDEFVAAYAAGETPNPCVQCNRELKFGELLRFARSLGADGVATGHYARVRARDSELELRRGRDRAKDQSYVLATVAPAALARASFPIGELTKDEVREHARRAGLPVHDKPESQELCFVPSGDYRDVLHARRPDLFSTGEIVDRDGRVLGEHDGTAGFTVGQRRGLRLGGGPARYVVATDPATNRVIVGERAELAVRSCRLVDVQWLAPMPATTRLLLQVRAHATPVAARLVASAAGTLDLELDAARETVTPGQIGVLYDDDRVIAAGRLRRRESPAP